ncbi:MAG TPA: hypothetical protein VMN36_03445 [Verrucomicrobiales bacterium]|nr:hypothetical protein [Verrucomicrobiales bacterium]
MPRAFLIPYRRDQDVAGRAKHFVTELIVSVTDNNPDAINEKQLTTTQTFRITVNEANQAPVLLVPADQVIDELSLLEVNASAIDADLPPNTLTYSLVDPPAGMKIDPLPPLPVGIHSRMIFNSDSAIHDECLRNLGGRQPEMLSLAETAAGYEGWHRYGTGKRAGKIPRLPVTDA